MPFAYDPNGNLVGTTGTGTGLNASSINGVTVTGTASNGQVLTATSATSATWQTSSGLTDYIFLDGNFGTVTNPPQFNSYPTFANGGDNGTKLSQNFDLTGVIINTSGKYEIIVSLQASVVGGGTVWVTPERNGSNLLPTTSGYILGLTPTASGPETATGFYVSAFSAGDVLKFPYIGTAFNSISFTNQDFRVKITYLSV